MACFLKLRSTRERIEFRKPVGISLGNIECHDAPAWPYVKVGNLHKEQGKASNDQISSLSVKSSFKDVAVALDHLIFPSVQSSGCQNNSTSGCRAFPVLMSWGAALIPGRKNDGVL